MSDNVNEISSLVKSINEIGVKLESNYATKSDVDHQTKKLADAIDALSKIQDKEHLANKTDPIFGNKAAALDFMEVIKSACRKSDYAVAREATMNESSAVYVSKDLNSWGTNTGPDTLPTSVSSIFSVLLAQYGVARREATVLSGVQGSISLPKRSGTSTAVFTNGGGVVKDDVAVTPSTLGTDKLTLTPNQISSLSLASDRLLFSSAVNLSEWIAVDLVENAGVLEDNTSLNGDGTYTYGGNTGIYQHASVPQISVVTTAFTTLNKLMDLPALVAESAYNSPNAKYYMHPKIIQLVREMAPSNYTYYYSPADGSIRLNGFEIVPWFRMDSANTNGKFLAVFGDMKKAAVVATGRDMSIDVSRDYKFNTNQTAFRLSYDFSVGLIQPTCLARLIAIS